MTASPFQCMRFRLRTWASLNLSGCRMVANVHGEQYAAPIGPETKQ